MNLHKVVLLFLVLLSIGGFNPFVNKSEKYESIVLIHDDQQMYDDLL